MRGRRDHSNICSRIAHVGTNRRYPDHGMRLADERELREATKRGPLRSLTAQQVALHANPLTIAPDQSRIFARAWLRFGDADVRATVRVLRWTNNAVGVGLAVDGQELRCWLWHGACTPANDTDGR